LTSDASSRAFASFYDLPLVEPLQRALAAAHYTTPTPIQAAAIPPLLAGQDLLGCAQTGTGKTAAFAIPVLQYLDTHRRRAAPKSPRVLVLSPTRELAAQIADSFATYGRFLKFRMTTVFGGVKQNPQVRDLARGVHLCVATPGRLLDLFQQGHLNFDQVETFILDEADRMLDMGFLPDLKRILRELPEQRHSLFFSATLPPPVRALAGELLQDHAEVMVTPSATTVEQIDQRLLRVEAADKLDLLVALLGSEATGQVLIFTKTRRGADRLLRQLPKRYADQAQPGRLRSAAIHSGKTQPARQRVLEAFKRGKVDVLIATDVAARGIDVEGLSHVINFDVPHEPESYVHRIGRTGRAGASGVAVSFCTPEEQRAWEAIEKLIGQAVPVDATQPFHTARQTSPRGRGSQGHAGQGKASQGRGSQAAGKPRSAGKSGGKTRQGPPNQPGGKRASGKGGKPGAGDGGGTASRRRRPKRGPS